jgi:hypothetical protein
MDTQQHLRHAIICPITQENFVDPVVAKDGFTYERHAITKWLKTKKSSPITRERMTHRTLIPNKNLKHVIKDLEKKKNEVIDLSCDKEEDLKYIHLEIERAQKILNALNSKIQQKHNQLDTIQNQYLNTESKMIDEEIKLLKMQDLISEGNYIYTNEKNDLIVSDFTEEYTPGIKKRKLGAIDILDDSLGYPESFVNFFDAN